MDCIKPRCIFRCHNISNKLYPNLLKEFLLIFIFSHYLDTNFHLISLLLEIRDLNNKHSGSYMNEVLLELLKYLDIEHDSNFDVLCLFFYIFINISL
jgi:hypothetical protein